MTNLTINVKVLNKNAEPYFEKIVSFEGSVISIEETSVRDSKDVISTCY